MKFDQHEKLAIIKITTDVIKVDGRLHDGEIKFLQELKASFDFDTPTIEEAENLDNDTALVTLNQMTYPKKKALVQTLKDVAVSDNHLHEKEMTLILETFTHIGLGEELE